MAVAGAAGMALETTIRAAVTSMPVVRCRIAEPSIQVPILAPVTSEVGAVELIPPAEMPADGAATLVVLESGEAETRVAIGAVATRAAGSAGARYSHLKVRAAATGRTRAHAMSVNALRHANWPYLSTERSTSESASAGSRRANGTSQLGR